ncbi:hypothetical protein BK645_27625 [Pseudomonas protegens]|nr:hypothetical protein BK645_27625 [Pseudomonas protegens]ROM32960.1 hypothetical protein BK646_28560 [Pseudomonas protegens]
MQRPYMPSLGDVQVLEAHDPAVAVTLQMTHLGLAENLRTVIAVVFLALLLQPQTQSPQWLHGSCSTPTWLRLLGNLAKVTLIGGL